MKKAKVIDIRSGYAAHCSRRVLHAFESKSLQALEKEVEHATVCRQVPESTLQAEQAELLEALLESMSQSVKANKPSLKMEISLLEHLAGR